MLPLEPVKRPQMGFLYVPPFRIQGISIAGEETVVQVPELDLAFDIGLCPKAVLPSKHVAITHGHMDHVAGIAYYFSQRPFQGMDPGTAICPKPLEQPIRNLMTAWIDIEKQQTKYNLIGVEPEQEVEIKNNHYLRAFPTVHTVPSLGYTVLEKRTKLKEEYVGLPQDQLVELKKTGKDITHTFMIPLVCFTGDTAFGNHLLRDDILNCKVIVTECTFMEPTHRKRAGIGKHLHLDHIIELLEASKAEAIILTHLSRRTNILEVRKTLDKAVPAKHRERLLVLMDSRDNRARYERQLAQAGVTAGNAASPAASS